MLMSRVLVVLMYGSCPYRVNIRIVSAFVNPNPTRIINVSIFTNLNSTYLLFVLGEYELFNLVI